MASATQFLRTHRRTVGVSDIPMALLSPLRLFARIEDVGAYVGPLVVLLALTTLAGYATVETGLIDRKVEEQIHAQKALIEKTQSEGVERAQLRKLFEDLDKQGQFMRVLTRLQVVVMSPLALLGGMLLTGGMFYGLVALSGRKPEWNTLMTILTFAGFIDLLRMLIVLGLMLQFGTLDVDVTLGALVRPLDVAHPWGKVAVTGAGVLLTAADPFAFWYWGFVLAGLKQTGQLRGWLAWTSVILLALTGAGLRVAGAAALSFSSAGVAGGQT